MDNGLSRIASRTLRHNSILQTSLDVLPNFVGTVYRGIDCEVDASLYVPGQVTIWPSFSSSTTNAQVFCALRPTILVPPQPYGDGRLSASLWGCRWCLRLRGSHL